MCADGNTRHLSRFSIPILLTVAALVAVVWLLSRDTHSPHRSSQAPDATRVAAEPSSTDSPQTPRLAGDSGSAMLLSVTVLDLANGKLAPGVPVSVSARASKNVLPVRAVSDRNGHISLPLRKGDVLSVEGDEWHLPPSFAVTELIATPQLWVYRMLNVVGAVTSADPAVVLDPRTVALSAVAVGLDGRGVPGHESPDPWSPLWMRRHGLEVKHDLPVPLADGSFAVTVPWIQGIAVRATAPGWRMASVLIPAATATDPVHVQLRLSPSFSVSGTLRARDGTPISGARVAVYVSKRARFADINAEKLRLDAHDAFTASWDVHQNEARVTDIAYADTDDAGKFAVESKVEGEILIVVHARGCVPLRRELGWVRVARDEGEIVLDRAVTAKTHLYYGDAPLTGHTVTLADLSVGDVQPAVEFDADDRGAIATEWLEEGRRYLIIVRGPRVPPEEFVGGAITWSGQAKFDMQEVAARYRMETGIGGGTGR